MNMTFFEPFEVEGVSFIYNRMDIIIMKAIPLTIAALSIVSYSAAAQKTPRTSNLRQQQARITLAY